MLLGQAWMDSKSPHKVCLSVQVITRFPVCAEHRAAGPVHSCLEVVWNVSWLSVRRDSPLPPLDGGWEKEAHSLLSKQEVLFWPWKAHPPG